MTPPDRCNALTGCGEAAACTSLLLSIDGTDRQTDGRTDKRTPYRYIKRSPSEAGSGNKALLDKPAVTLRY